MDSEAQTEQYGLLTPREREVLALVQRGLTNAEIAEQLGISLDGAKYHVSEIIGKLGLRSRYDAAVWPERRWWATGGLAPFALWSRRAFAEAPGRLSWLAAALSIAVFAAVLAGLGLLVAVLVRSGDGSPAGPAEASVCPSQPTPEFEGEARTFEDVARRAAQTATCPGYVLVLRSSGDFDAGPYSNRRETEIWIDLESQRGRRRDTVVFTSREVLDEYAAEGRTPPELKSETIFLGNAEYFRQYYGEEQNQFDFSTETPCYEDAGVLVELLVPCDEPGATEDVTFSIEPGAPYRGKEALALVESGISRGSDETYDTTSRVYIDPASFLPIGQTTSGTLDIGETFPVDSDIPHEYRFVAADGLPADLFDPASIGYVTHDFEREMEEAQLGIPLYWLGEELSASDGLPSLVLDSVFIYGEQDEEGLEMPIPLLRFNYRRPDDKEGAVSVRLRVYSADDWQRYQGEAGLTDGREIELPYGRAVIYELGDRSAPAGRSYSASVHAGDAVTYIEPLLRFEGASQTPVVSPYDAEAAIAHLVRSLTRIE